MKVAIAEIFSKSVDRHGLTTGSPPRNPPGHPALARPVLDVLGVPDVADRMVVGTRSTPIRIEADPTSHLTDAFLITPRRLEEQVHEQADRRRPSFRRR